MRVWIVVFLLLSGIDAQAEYRMFKLRIVRAPAAATPPGAPPPATEERFVETTLDPVQYRDYYTVAPDESVTYVETWRCRGRTDGFKPHCPNPRPPAETPPSP